VNTNIANRVCVFSTENTGQWTTLLSHGTNHQHFGTCTLLAVK